MAEGFRAFQFVLSPTVKQERALTTLFLEQCRLYNAALEERRGVWQLERRAVSRFDQYKTLTGMADQEPTLMAFGVTVARGTLLRLDRAFKAFFRRAAAGETPGFPRFRSARRFDSVEWPDTDGWRIDETTGRLYLRGIGHLKVRLHRAIRGLPKTITVRRRGRRWRSPCFARAFPHNRWPPTGNAVGIDVGVTVAFALSTAASSTTRGTSPARPSRWLRLNVSCQGAEGVRCRRVKATEAVGVLHRKIANQRRDFLHKQSRALVNDHDLIVIEDLRVTNMTRRPKPVPDEDGGFDPNGAATKAGLNKSILDVGWRRFRSMLAYKAEEA